MSEPFDPYYRWLGIPAKEQPPNHYRLIGIELFESDRQVIDSVASRHIGYLQEITDGPHVKDAQRLLNELAAARRCLLDPEQKAAYDAELKAKLAAELRPPKDAAPPRRRRVESCSPVPPPPKMSPHALTTRPASGKEPPAVATRVFGEADRRGLAAQRKNTKPVQRAAVGVVGVLVALIALIVVAGLLLRGVGTREEQTRQTRPKQNGAVAAQMAAKLKHPASTGIQNPPGHLVSQADLDTSPLPDVGLEAPIATDHLPMGRQRQEGPPAAVIGPDGKPARADSLLLWLDASDRSRVKAGDDARISRWTDNSGKGCHATADGADRCPELVQDVLGGHPVARFSGSQCLQIEGKSESFKTGSEYTFLFVARGPNGTLVSKGSGDSPGSFAMREGVASFFANGTRLNAQNDDGSRFRVRAVVADKNALSWYVDGQPCGTFSTADHHIQSASRVRIGAIQKRGKGLQEFLEGEVAEILVYDRPLADDERRAIEAYLRGKWLPECAPPLPGAKTEAPLPKEAAEDTGEPDSATVVAAMERDSDELRAHDEVHPQHTKGFVVLTPLQAEASAGSKLRVLDNGEILSDGASKSNETYRITVETDIPGMTALRLEALPHDRLPGKGPGLGLGGRFSLAEFKVSVRPKEESAPEREVSFARALAGDVPGAERLIDGDDKTSWSVRRRGRRVAVTLIPAEPIGSQDVSVLAVTVKNGDNLGCFRLLATSAPDPATLPAAGGTADGDQQHNFTLFVNLGGDAWQEPDGNAWVKSKEFDRATFGHEGGQSLKEEDVENPVFKTARRGLTAFRAIVPNGVYEVRLYFSEHWTTDPKRRVFAVFVEQQLVGRSPGVFYAPGMGGPYIHSIPKVTVNDGRLDVEFAPAHKDASAILNGISIRQLR